MYLNKWNIVGITVARPLFVSSLGCEVICATCQSTHFHWVPWLPSSQNGISYWDQHLYKKLSDNILVLFSTIRTSGTSVSIQIWIGLFWSHCKNPSRSSFYHTVKSQRSTFLSYEPDTIFVSLNWRHVTPSVWLRRVTRRRPLSRFHTFIVLSSDPLTSLHSSACIHLKKYVKEQNYRSLQPKYLITKAFSQINAQAFSNFEIPI